MEIRQELRQALEQQIPNKFFIALTISTINESSEQKSQMITNKELEGLEGITDKAEILTQVGGVAKDSLLVMNGQKVDANNDILQLNYDDAEALVEDNLALIGRLFTNQGDEPRERQQRMLKSLNHIFREWQNSSDENFASVGSEAIQRGWPNNVGRYWENNFIQIHSIRDFAEFLQEALDESVRESASYFGDSLNNVLDGSLRELEEHVRRGVLAVGDIYDDEGEWIVQNDIFQIPSNSGLIMMYTIGTKSDPFDLPDELKQMIKSREIPQEDLEEIAFGDSLLLIDISEESEEKFEQFDVRPKKAKRYIQRLLEAEQFGLDESYDLRLVPVASETDKSNAVDVAKGMSV